MSSLTHHQIDLLVLVSLLVVIVQAEGKKNNQTVLTGVHQNARNGSAVDSPWLKRVNNQRRPGCRDRPWICHRGQFPPFRRLCCRNRCVDVTSDPSNCGLCGIRCPFTWQCCGGLCTDTNLNPFNCGRCGNRCPFLTFCTYGFCGYAEPFPPFPFPPFPFPPRPPKLCPPNPPKPPCPWPKLPQPPQGQHSPQDGQPSSFYGQSPPCYGQPPLLPHPSAKFAKN